MALNTVVTLKYLENVCFRTLLGGKLGILTIRKKTFRHYKKINNTFKGRIFRFEILKIGIFYLSQQSLNQFFSPTHLSGLNFFKKIYNF